MRKDDGYLVCPIFCGYEEPLEVLPTEPKEIKAVKAGQDKPTSHLPVGRKYKKGRRVRGPAIHEEIKIQAAVEVIDGLLRDLYGERVRLNKQLADINHRISALEMAKGIVETGG